MFVALALIASGLATGFLRPTSAGASGPTSPHMVANVSVRGASLNPYQLTDANGMLFFLTSAPGGSQLWRSDGTTGGTIDLASFDNTSQISGMTAVGGDVFFTWKGDLWRSDGTIAGTGRVASLPAGPGGLTGLNGTLIAFSQTTIYVFGLDGSVIRQITFTCCFQSEFAKVGNSIEFTTLASVGNQMQLWTTDGSVAGTRVLSTFTNVSYLSATTTSLLNGSRYFLVNRLSGVSFSVELWKTDGTSTGTMAVASVGSGARAFVVANGLLQFEVAAGPSGTANSWWRSDGTTAGTRPVVTLPDQMDVDRVVSIGGEALLEMFTTNDETSTVLWHSDGTALGTGPVAVSSSTCLCPTNLAAVNGVAYFAGDDGVHGSELWRSDGTTAGTRMVADIWAGAHGSSPYNMTASNGQAFFVADDGAGGFELWRSDGTSAATSRLSTGGSSPSIDPSLQSLANVGGRLFFAADDGVHGDELWSSDGSAAGTGLVSDINPGANEPSEWDNDWLSSNSSWPASVTDVNGTAYFVAFDGSDGAQLWRSDGTSAGTRMLTKNAQASPFNLLDVNGVLVFETESRTGTSLWRSDGTVAGTTKLADLSAVPFGGKGSGYGAVASNGVAVFGVPTDNNSGAWSLWRSDGTAAGTFAVASNLPQWWSSSIVTVGSKFYFVAGSGLWGSDGTASGTSLVTDAVQPQSLTVSNNTLFFAAVDASHGQQLWKSDGTAAGTTMVTDVANGLGVYNPTDVGGTLYFVSGDNNKYALWSSDGTPGGTGMVADIGPNFPSYLTEVFGTLYFIADDGVHGSQVWHGSTAGIGMVTSGISAYGPMVAINGTLYFSTLQGVNGSQLWSFTVPSATLSGTLRDGTGGPVANARVALTGPSGISQTTSDAGGHYSLHALTGSYTLAVNGTSATGGNVPSQWSVQTAFTLSDDTVQDLQLPSSVNLTATASFQSGVAVAGATVSTTSDAITPFQLFSGATATGWSQDVGEPTGDSGIAHLRLFPTPNVSAVTASFPGSAPSANATASNVDASSDNSVTLQLADPPPVVGAIPDRAPNVAGWYSSPVTVHWSVTDPYAAASQPADIIAGTEGANVPYMSGHSCDAYGNCASGSFGASMDQTPPTIAATILTPQNSDGSYTAPFVVHWSCSDVLSGVASCNSDTSITTPGSGLSVTGHAADVAGNQASETMVNLTIVPYFGPPTAPLNVSASGAAGSIRVQWSAPQLDGGSPISSYIVYRGSSASSLSPLATVDPSTMSYTDSGLDPGTSWFYAVAAVNGHGTGVSSSTVQAATPALNANLGIVGSVVPTIVRIGDPLTYTFTVSNGGSYTAQNATVAGNPTAGVTISAAVPSQGTCTGTSATALTCSLGAIASGSTATVTVTASSKTVGAAGLSATAQSGTPDDQPANNTASPSATVAAGIGTIAGRITESDHTTPVPLALIDACSTTGGSCFDTFAAADGSYSMLIPADSYILVASAASHANTTTPVTVADTQSVAIDLSLAALTPPPPGGVVPPPGAPPTPPGQVPVVPPNQPGGLYTTGCAGGTASYSFSQNGIVVQHGAMPEGPTGTYTATVPAFTPLAGGYATVDIVIVCSDTSTSTSSFNVEFTDPSGVIRTIDGTPLSGATVTLEYAPTVAGPFVALPTNSPFLSSGTAQNPMTSDAQGRFAWDTAPGFYRVRASKPGCVSPFDARNNFVESEVFRIPPVVSGLDLRLDCSADSDNDGYHNATELALGSNPNNASSTPENPLVYGSCLDRLDNNLNRLADFNKTTGRGDPGCSALSGHLSTVTHQVALGKIKAPKLSYNPKNGKVTVQTIALSLKNALGATANSAKGLPAGQTETVSLSIWAEQVTPGSGCNLVWVDNPATPENEGQTSRTLAIIPGQTAALHVRVGVQCTASLKPGTYGWRLHVAIAHVPTIYGLYTTFRSADANLVVLPRPR